MSDKCIVQGCLNHKHQGEFLGDLCTPCYDMITSGEIKYGGTFLHGLRDRTEELEAKLAESQAQLSKAMEEKLDATKALKAWFDCRKLAHDVIDQAVVDAAAGYLHTSRVGGMSQEKSDLVLGIIQDMARLSVFADLSARAKLTGESHD